MPKRKKAGRNRPEPVEREQAQDETQGADHPPSSGGRGDQAATVSGSAVEQEDEQAGGVGLVELPEAAVQRLSGEIEELRDRYLRVAAEFDNFRKRTARERSELWTRAQAQLVSNVLDALDDLGRVIDLDPAEATTRDVVSGVEMVERKLMRELEGAGLMRVGREGERFDPNDHEAVGTVPAPSADQDGTVAAVLQPGYRFGGALLRPARVRVYLADESQPNDAESEA